MTRSPTVRPCTDESQAGFTLVELLVALALLGFIMVALFSGLSFGARVWERSEAQSSRTQEIQLVHRVLSDLVARAFPAVVEQDGEFLYEFEGGPDDLRFVTYMPPFLDAGGLNQVSLRVVESDRKHQLRLMRRAHEALAPESETDQEDTLLFETEDALSFGYFGSTDGEQEPAWRDTWEAEHSPPRLVRLKIGDREDAQSFWPELVIALSIEMDLPCINPGFVGRCRLLEVSRP